MRCEKTRDLILDYTTNDLDQTEEIQVETHIRKCRECNQFFELANWEWKLLDEWREVEPKEDFINIFWDRVSNEEISKEKSMFTFLKNWELNWSAVSALSVFLVIGIISIMFVISDQKDIVYTDNDKADEELLFELDRTISLNATDLLEVYGMWDQDLIENRGER